jgi:SAM-dependent methyltransferase
MSSKKTANGKSLDLGCGNNPRNPYNYEELFGIDLTVQKIAGVQCTQANLALESIPFPDNYFDRVTAFDFIEHIPRILSVDAARTRAPFIELMNEIWRVLKPNGVFYAVTPFYPHPAAFQDPTHVNIITRQTHEYFCGKMPPASIYGFIGSFEKLRTEAVVFKTAVTSDKSIRKSLYHLQKRLINPCRLSHFLWELKANK